MIEFDASEVDKLAADLVTGAAKVDARTEAEVLSKAGRELQSKAKAAVPVRTGALRDSIYLRGGKGYRDVGSDERYSTFVEFGTYKDAPQPFLFNNVAGVEREMLDSLGDIADDVL